ncbi:class I SAM-dependent methyltransferase [Lacrimispora brassicae]
MEKQENIQRLSHSYWSQRAEEFSQLRMQDYESPLYPAFKEFLRKNMPETGAPLKALDAGCGAGFFSMLLSELGCEVTGVDFSQDMLRQAAKNARDTGHDRISFLHMDIQNMGFSDEAFDFIVTRNVTWVLPDASRAYEEMMRVLRPGGVLLNMDSNYGKAFNESDARGETPSHPSQSLEQLKMRNFIARDLEITRTDRPEWDMVKLWKEGAASVCCYRDLEKLLGIGRWNHQYTKPSASSRAVMFAVAAWK